MAISNAVTDIALLILPFPMLYNTQLDRKQYEDSSIVQVS